MNITAFVESTAGLIAAIGALMTGLAAILNTLQHYRLAAMAAKEVEMKRPLTVSLYLKVVMLMGVLLVLISGSLLLSRALSQGPQALNVELTVAAWDAFNKGNFPRAIANADKCISEFMGAADRKQSELEKSKTPSPPTGTVSEDQKRAILVRGLLNDVATCFYIKGRSAENLGQMDEARKAYEKAAKYTYARCWDPKGWFWSPAEASQDRLAGLR